MQNLTFPVANRWRYNGSSTDSCYILRISLRSYSSVLDQIKHCMAELQPISLSWRVFEMTSNFAASLQPRPLVKSYMLRKLSSAMCLDQNKTSLESIGLNLWEEFVKVRGLEMTKTSDKLHVPFIIADFLWELEQGSMRLFCRSEDDTSVTQSSCLQVEAYRGARHFKKTRWRY